MRYYRRIFSILLLISITLVLCLEILFISSYLMKTGENFRGEAEKVSQAAAAFTDYRLSASERYSAILRASEYTDRFLRDAEPLYYNRFRFCRFIQATLGLEPAPYAMFAVTRLTDNYVIMDNGTSGVPFFLRRFGLSGEKLDGLLSGFNPGSYTDTSFLTLAGADGSPLYVLVRQERLPLRQPLYIFAAYTGEQFFDSEALGLQDGTLILFRDGRAVAAGGSAAATALSEAGELKGYDRFTIASQAAGYRYEYYAMPPKARGPVALMLAGGLFLLVIVGLLMLLIAKRMYLPVRELLGLVGVDRDNRDEFLHIKKQILRMENDVGEYEKTLENLFYRDLLEGRVAWPGTGAERAAEGERASGREWFARFWPKGDYGCFMVVLIRREQSEIGESGLSGKIADFTKPDPRQILDRLLRRAAFSRVVALKPDTDAVILAFGSRGDTEFVSGALKEALLRAETEHDLLFTAVCSAPAASADELPAAYRQAYFLLESGDVSLKGAKVLVAEEAARPKETAYFPLGVEQALNSALAQNKPELWRSILKDVVQTNKARGAKDFSRLALMFTAAVNRMMDSLDMGAAEIFDGEKNLYQELSAGADPDEFYDRACRVCSVLSNEMAVAQKRLSPAAVEKMEEFINANYQNDISLFDLAAHLNLSKNYVSTLFKNATGMNFKDYVNQVRYEAARALFDKYPSMKVKDAAEKTGCSADILTRLFIRYAGMPPREYQNRKR